VVSNKELEQTERKDGKSKNVVNDSDFKVHDKTPLVNH